MSEHEPSLLEASFSPDAKRVVTRGRNDAALWDAETGKKIDGLAGHGAPAKFIAHSPDGRWIVTSDGVETHLWDGASGKHFKRLDGTIRDPGAILAHDGGVHLILSDDRGLSLWEASSEAPTQEFTGKDLTGSWGASPESILLFVGSSKLRLKDVKSRATALEAQTRRKFIAISQDGVRVLVAAEKMLEVWDTRVRAPIRHIDPNGGIAAVALSPNGAWAAAGLLLLLTDVPGVMDRNGNLIESLTTTEARALIADGTISGGMIPKVETCIDAVERGVSAAVILDGRIQHVILIELFTEHGAGTMITRG